MRPLTAATSKVAPALAAALVTVALPPDFKERDPNSPRPAHHLNDTKSSFVNPWPSFRPQLASALLKYFADSRPKIPHDIHELVRHQKPRWSAADTDRGSQATKATWLGHACFLVELPTPPGASEGPRILFDPVFSHRCSPSQLVGPGRYTKPPCEIKDIPAPAIVVISHNHYDHLDTHTIQTLEDLHKPHFFAPLGNDHYFECMNIPKERIHCLDWWDRRDVTVELLPASASIADESAASDPAADTIKATFAVTCTPAQHFTGRGILDRFRSLWASWAIEDLPSSKADDNGTPPTGVKLWFAGDTGYRAVYDGENEDDVPVCPEFKKIGEKFGGFDLAFIPIGAYLPRGAMSPVHCAPQDSVRVFKDVRAKRAIGMHWATWVLTNEGVMDPPKRLAEECAKIGIAEGLFNVCGMGETVEV